MDPKELKELEVMVDSGLELYPDDPGYNLVNELVKQYKEAEDVLYNLLNGRDLDCTCIIYSDGAIAPDDACCSVCKANLFLSRSRPETP
jgi:hypothetical protein